MPADKVTTHAVILAGGRGTRFWPRSRTRTPKQLLNIVGKETMLQQTVARLRPLIPPERIWTVTNSEQAQEVRRQVPAPARAFGPAISKRENDDHDKGGANRVSTRV